MFQKPYCLDLWVLFDGQNFLMAIEHFSSQQTLSEGVRTVDGHWCARLHLLGFCLLACACTGLQSSEKEKRIGEAVRCFFQFVSDSSVVDVTSWNLRMCCNSWILSTIILIVLATVYIIIDVGLWMRPTKHLPFWWVICTGLHQVGRQMKHYRLFSWELATSRICQVFPLPHHHS